MSGERYIGLMSGTSVDAVDVALVAFDNNSMIVEATLNWPIDASLRQEIIAICTPGDNEIERMGLLDNKIGDLFADATNELLQRENRRPADIRAIGSHGQTIRHRPTVAHPFTLQIGNPALVARRTGIDTVADFRRADIAAGGQGAPLVPAFHQAVFRNNRNRVILNIGGMANITVLPKTGEGIVIGFDTGPGNVLINTWIEKHQGNAFDKNGDWGASGRAEPTLLNSMLSDAFFTLPPPKSTGRELFNIAWIDQHLAQFGKKVAAVDVQATLTAVTAQSIARQIIQHAPATEEVLICGGGVHNGFLMQLLAVQLPSCTVRSTAEMGVDPDYVEAATFAWLAKQTIDNKPGNLPSVTGAKQSAVLGAVYPA